MVIALSVVAFNLREMDGPLGHYHRFSLYFLLPYLGTTLPLLYHNWYPSSVFPGKKVQSCCGIHMAWNSSTLHSLFQATRFVTSAG